MAAPAISRKESLRRKRAIEAALRQGYRPVGASGSGPAALAVAAERLGIDRPSLHNSLIAMKRRHGIEPDWGLAAPAAPAKAARDETLAENKKLRRERDAAVKKAEGVADLRRSLFDLKAPAPSPPTWTAKKRPGPRSPGVPTLFASDWQWGEVIRSDAVAGINAYSSEIAAARYGRLIERTVDLCFRHMTNPDYPGILYHRGGDMVSGRIHPDLAESNDAQPIAAVKHMVACEEAGIKELLRAGFKKIVVSTVAGNHGRDTLDKRSKGVAENNYDTLSAWWLERAFKGDARVSFRTATGPDIVYAVYGYRFCLTHGDRIGSRGGQGFIGPGATIARGMKKIIDFYAALGQPIDWVLTGHFHTRMELEYGFSNGTMAGYSEFARDGRFRPVPPEQWLFFTHPRYGVTARWPIILEDRPRAGEAAALPWEKAK